MRKPLYFFDALVSWKRLVSCVHVTTAAAAAAPAIAAAAAVAVAAVAAAAAITAAGFLTFLPSTSLESSLYAFARQPCMALRYRVTAERRAGAELAFKRWLRSVAVRGRGLSGGEEVSKNVNEIIFKRSEGSSAALFVCAEYLKRPIQLQR